MTPKPPAPSFPPTAHDAVKNAKELGCAGVRCTASASHNPPKSENQTKTRACPPTLNAPGHTPSALTSHATRKLPNCPSIPLGRHRPPETATEDRTGSIQQLLIFRQQWGPGRWVAPNIINPSVMPLPRKFPAVRKYMAVATQQCERVLRKALPWNSTIPRTVEGLAVSAGYCAQGIRRPGSPR